jgi:hypothetical protein
MATAMRPVAGIGAALGRVRRGRVVGVIAMRRLGIIVALCTALGLFGAAVTSAPALAGRGPKWQFLPFPPETLPAVLCGFKVHETAPADKEYLKVPKTADGSMTFLATGALRLTLTNLKTGKSITESVSGPAKFITHPDGSATLLGRGRGLLQLPPAQAARFGFPTLSIDAGAGTITFAPDGTITSLSLRGHVVVNVCTALS